MDNPEQSHPEQHQPTTPPVLAPTPVIADMVLGTDLVHAPRLRHSFQRYGQNFFHKILTPDEWNYCLSLGTAREAQLVRRVAGRVALKEAVAKALGIGINGLGWSQGAHWKEIEIVGQSQSPPGIRLHGRALETASNLRIGSWRCSLSHDGDYALATVIGLIRLGAG